MKIDGHHATQFTTPDGTVIKEGDWITIDGTEGVVYDGALEVEAAGQSGDFGTLMGWADEFRTMGVRANADTPEQAAEALALGAEGIGLCRTEHMFLEEDRLPIVRRMILAEDEDRASDSARRTACRFSAATSSAFSARWTASPSRCA